VAAAAALRRAAKATETLRSYRFSATVVTATPKSRLTTTLTGTVVRGVGVSYSLASGGHRTQVIRVRRATYLRKVPGKWSRLRKPIPVSDPTASLLAILRGLATATASSASSGTTVTGTLTRSASAAAKLPTGGASTVIVVIGRDGRVDSVRVTVATTAGTAPVRVTSVTRFSGFDLARTVKAPV
jgi:hypothetical protein